MGKEGVEVKDGFSWIEKLLMRGGLAAVVGIGAFAIYRIDPPAAVGYLVLVALGGLAVMYDSLCVYCPYPYKHSDCLFFPYQLVASVTTMRTTPIPPFRKALSALAFLGIVAIPQYWLWGQWGFLAAFWALTAAGGIAVPLHFCRHCRHSRCPMNLATLQTEGQP
jgi:hypothetical protein